MQDRTLQAVLRVIPVLILVVCLVLPFSGNGWDTGAAILPSNPFLGIGARLLPLVMGGDQLPRQGPVVSLQGSGISRDGSRVFADVRVTNPLPLQMDIREFSGSIPAGGIVLTLAMIHPVAIPAGSSAVVRLEGPSPPGLVSPGSLPTPGPVPGDLKMTVSLLGMEMTLDEKTLKEMVS